MGLYIYSSGRTTWPRNCLLPGFRLSSSTADSETRKMTPASPYKEWETEARTGKA